MRHGRVVLCLLAAAGCVDITVNDKDGAGGAGSSVCSAGGTGGGSADASAGLGGASFAPPRATDSLNLRGNLDQTAVAMQWDPSTPKTTSNFATSLTVYDSVGKAIQWDLYFCKNDGAHTMDGDSGDWTYHVMTDGANLDYEANGTTPGTPGIATQIAQGTLRFDRSGRLVSNELSDFGFYPSGGKRLQVVALNFGTGTASGGNGLDGLTQYAATSAITFVGQTGSPALPLP